MAKPITMNPTNPQNPLYPPAGVAKVPNDPQYRAAETPENTPQLPCFVETPGHVDTGVTHDGDMGRLGQYK